MSTETSKQKTGSEGEGSQDTNRTNLYSSNKKGNHTKQEGMTTPFPHNLSTLFRKSTVQVVVTGDLGGSFLFSSTTIRFYTAYNLFGVLLPDFSSLEAYVLFRRLKPGCNDVSI
jgi:hypothetical protein